MSPTPVSHFYVRPTCSNSDKLVNNVTPFSLLSLCFRTCHHCYVYLSNHLLIRLFWKNDTVYLFFPIMGCILVKLLILLFWYCLGSYLRETLFCMTKEKNNARNIAVNNLIYERCGHTAFSLVHTTTSLTESGEGRFRRGKTIDNIIIIFVRTTVFVPTEEYPKPLEWIGSVTVCCDCLACSMCVCVCVCACVCVCVVPRNCLVCYGWKRVCEYLFLSFLLLLFYLYVYVGCPKFSPNTTDILTNITCYIVNNTLIKDATLSVWNAWFIIPVSEEEKCHYRLRYFLTITK